MTSVQRIGVYFSANDRVYPWARAFLASFRAHNPDLELVLIPFDDACERVLALREEYGFSVYEDAAGFPRLEAIGEALELGHTPTGPRWFRRYAAFWGPLDRFFYLDTRQVVLADLRPALEALDADGFDFLHYDCALDQVYEPGPWRRDLLRRGRARGFLSGMWTARRGLVSLEDFERFGREAVAVREHLNPRNTDQAFINYCVDHSDLRVGHLAEILGGVVSQGWARQPGRLYRDSGDWRLWDHGGLDHRKRLILLHWAGYRRLESIPHFSLFARYYTRGQGFLATRRFSLALGLRRVLRLPVDRARAVRSINFAYRQLTRAR